MFVALLDLVVLDLKYLGETNSGITAIAACSTPFGKAGDGKMVRALATEACSKEESYNVGQRCHACDSQGVTKKKHTLAVGCEKFI